MRTLLTPWLVVPAALAAMAALMYAAVRADCVRIAAEHDAAVRIVDDELLKLEERWSKLTGQANTAAAGGNVDERHFRFQRQVEAAGNAVSDEAAGAANRWRVMERDYAERAAERDAYHKSWRGKLARRASNEN